MEKLKKPKHRSKVRQFYSEFNSNSSSSSPSSSVSENGDPQVFTFGHVEAPKLYKRTAIDAGWNSPGSHYSPQPPLMSPTRLNENQDITEFALDKHYQRKINDLKRNIIRYIFYSFKEKTNFSIQNFIRYVFLKKCKKNSGFIPKT